MTNNTESTGKARLLVVDDHPIIRQGIAAMINRQDDMCTCGEAADVAEALKLIETCKPELAIVDLSLKEDNGIELIKDIKVRRPDTKVLVLSMKDEALFAERALRAGAQGYIMKEAATENVLTAIRQVLEGGVYLSEKMSARLLSKLVGGRQGADQGIQALSDREMEVFEYIGQGLPTREIAEKMHLSVKTVETYRANIKSKLHIHSAAELVQHAIQHIQSR